MIPDYGPFPRAASRRRVAAFATFASLATFAGLGVLPGAYAQDTALVAPAAQVVAPEQAYTQAVKGADGQVSGVQTAIRRFTPAKSDGPTVYLVAVTHIGEKAYYQDIQKLLDTQDLVLFEGVRPGKDEGAKPIEEQKADREKAHSLQKRLSDDLGVQFQLEGIQYKRANFRNSDLSWDDLMAVAKQSGANSEADLNALKATMSGGGPESGATGAMLYKLLGSLEKNPAMSQMFRRVLITTLADPNALKRMTTSVRTASGAPVAAPPAAPGTTATVVTAPPSPDFMETVLIEARNKAVLQDLKTASATLKPGASVALLYGAGHMQDMAHRLETELGYTPADVRWLTALNVAPASATAAVTPQ